MAIVTFPGGARVRAVGLEDRRKEDPEQEAWVEWFGRWASARERR